MKEKLSHSTSRALSLVLVAMLLFAQGITLSAQNFWLDGANAVGIRQDTTVREAYAEIYSGLRKGEFHATNGADFSWNAGARAEALVHLAKFSMEGAFSFNQVQGNGMCGSLLNDPGYYPVDVLEFTPGKKTKQTYAFNGGISVDVADNWRVGGKLDFMSANTSKRKDIRYTDYALDMTFAPGVVYTNGNWSVGLDYTFHRTTEAPKAEQLGQASTLYYAFLDKGLMYGSYELWNGGGVHLNESGVNGFPIAENSHGFGVQLQHGKAFLEIDYSHGNGKVGEKQYIWFRFPSNSVSFLFGDSFEGKNGEHIVRVEGSIKGQDNYETTLDKVSEGGVTTIKEYGSNQILHRTMSTLGAEYEYESHKWSLATGVEVEEELSTASQMYPYVMEENLYVWKAFVRPAVKLGRADLSLNLFYLGGKVSENEREVVEDSGITTEMFRLTDWYEKSIEYKTAHRVGANISASYTFWKGLYARLDLGGVRAFGLKYYDKPLRGEATLSIGYKF